MDLTPFASLPIDGVLDELRMALAQRPAVVLQAEPGAGKTTRVPLALLEEPWLNGQKILMLEPRRIAARAAAQFMAAQRGECAGESIGYRTRLESKIGAQTQIEVVTEGILTRMLQNDPELHGVGLIIFDEFHERSLQADLGLALALEVQELVASERRQLRLLVMSATLDGAAVAALLDDAPLIRSGGRSYPVGLRFRPRRSNEPLETAVTAAVLHALEGDEGDVLVFLPGSASIRRVQGMLANAAAEILPLYGDLAAEQQNRALRRGPAGRRRVVLATNIAETSLTIEGIRVVIDGGLARQPRFDPGSGMTRLETVRISAASAEQRRGRAGRLEAGICYRLWGESDRLAPFDPPELQQSDLAPLVLELALWGVADPHTLRWLDPPPRAAYAQARALLLKLEALDSGGRITPLGRRMAQLGLHPRLSHMVLRAELLGVTALALLTAALLGERDPLNRRSVDITERVERLTDRSDSELDHATKRRVVESAKQLRRRLYRHGAQNEMVSEQLNQLGLLLAFAYPDRIALPREESVGRFQLANGRGAYLDERDPLARAEALVATDLDGAAREARIYLAAPITREQIEQHFGEQIAIVDVVAWDGRLQEVRARRERRLDHLLLGHSPLSDPDPEAVARALIQGVTERGLDTLPWSPALREWQQRVQFLHQLDPASWPDLSDASLLERLNDWLLPYLPGMSRFSHLARLDLTAALTQQLDWSLRSALDRLAPSHLEVPSGSRIRLRYGEGELPVLAVRLQELFGMKETPRVADGRVPVLIHLLSPARRPVQITRDLASFWANTYAEVKRDLKGRYPKHYWPEDPLESEPTRGVRRRR